MEIKLLIFDFDGTLFDTSDSIAHVINFTLRKFNKKELDKEIIWTYTGDGLKKTIERAFINCDKDTIEEAYKVAIEYYSSHAADFVVPIDNVIEFLQSNSKKKVILSNKPVQPMIKILEKFNVLKHFDAIYGYESMEYVKPDPRTVEIILQKFKVKEEEAALIGDADQDILTAVNAGIKCFIIPSKQINVKTNYTVFRDYSELEKILQNKT